MPTSAEVLEALVHDGPPKGTIWQHFKGKRYMVLCCAIIEKDLEPAVVYKSLDDGVVWVRPLGVWEEIVKHDGKLVARFTREDE